jgi:hypothetical protein
MKDCNDVKPGMRVRIGKLGNTAGMAIAKEYLDSRAEGATGTIRTWVPGHGGDVWFVHHGDSIGAYCFTEFEEIP